MPRKAKIPKITASSAKSTRLWGNDLILSHVVEFWRRLTTTKNQIECLQNHHRFQPDDQDQNCGFSVETMCWHVIWLETAFENTHAFLYPLLNSSVCGIHRDSHLSKACEILRKWRNRKGNASKVTSATHWFSSPRRFEWFDMQEMSLSVEPCSISPEPL